MHARARGVEISTYAFIKYTSVIKLFDYITSPSFTHTTGMTHFLEVHSTHSGS